MSALTNYREIGKHGSSAGAGFQYEFQCARCSSTWTSPYKPYRKGQLAGLIYKFAYFLGDRGSLTQASSGLAQIGQKRAGEQALQEALDLAEQRYTVCPSCDKAVCENCWDPRTRRCEACDRSGSGSRHVRSAHGDREARGDRYERNDPDGRDEPDRSGYRADQVRHADSEGAGSANLSCPNCRAAFGSGRFCAECGFDMASTHKSCPGCGTLCVRAARFCTDCGHGF